MEPRRAYNYSHRAETAVLKEFGPVPVRPEVAHSRKQSVPVPFHDMVFLF